MKPEIGKFYIDGNGAVHGPIRPHPSDPETFVIAVGATYYAASGKHTAHNLTPDHEALNLVREVLITEIN
jgi:hypothetical protein